jgi:GT2 family glycosyltransferase
MREFSPHPMHDLSIIIPTCNRPEHLGQLLNRLHEDLKCSHEIIVVSSTTDNQTHQVLADAVNHFGDRLKIIHEEKREGFVRAANKGFRAATARNMIWLNDDARPLPGTLDEAVRQIDAAPNDIAFLAMFHAYASTKNIAYEAQHEGRTFSLCHVRGTLYANFPIGRRQTYETLGYFDEQFYFYAADPDLSLKAWHANLRIAPAHNCFIDHDEHQDNRRAEDTDRGNADNAKLFAKWNLPEKNLEQNDFNPNDPCTLDGLRATIPISPSPLTPATGTPGEGRGGGSPEFALKPLITFLLATHNRKTATLNTLSKLQSLERSGDFHTQTIIIDNASTDCTPEAIAEQFPAVHLIRQKKNHGACSKNAGLPTATGDFIIFLDDDSYPDANSIRRMITHFQNDPRLGAAIFNVTLPDGSREASAFPTVCIGCGTAFRREALIAAGGLPTDFFMQAEEYDLSLRLLDAGWDLRRFDDLHVSHLKTTTARRPARTTRLDIRNNLLVISRNFPRYWIRPYAKDWIQRYHWLAAGRGIRHRFAFYHGLLGGLLKSLIPNKRRAISDGAFEKFAMINRIRAELTHATRRHNLRRVLLIDVGKNLYAYWLAARALNLNIVAIADNSFASPDRKYRGIPIIDDTAARILPFDAVIIANDSPIHAPIRSATWRAMISRPVLTFSESPAENRLAA